MTQKRITQIQQSLEFYLKGLVELQGNEYCKNHDLRAQLNILSMKDQELIDICEIIRINANTFTSWERDSRYNDDFIATKADIEIGLDLCEKLYIYTNKLINTSN